MSANDRKEWLRKRYAPIYTLASTVQIFGFFLFAGNGLVALAVLTMMSGAPAYFGGAMFALTGFVLFGLASIFAAMLRAFGDVAVWTAPGISDDGKFAIAHAAAGGGGMSNADFSKAIGM